MMRQTNLWEGFKKWFSAGDRGGQRVARICSGIVILIGCLGLVGWSFNISVFKSVLPGTATMKANTALCLILAGVSLGLKTRIQWSIRATRIAQGCAIAVGTIGLLTLSQYFFGWDLGIDQLLFQDQPISAKDSYPGRMGDNTALNFVLIGGALWLTGRRIRYSNAIAQLATVGAAAIALLALLGYAYHVEVFYQFIVYSSAMSINTAVAFLVLSGGILGLRSDRGLMQPLTQNTIGSIAARRFILLAIVIPAILGWLILQGLRAKLYNPAFSLALLVVALTFILVTLIWKTTQNLNNMESDRKRSSDRLRSSEERFELAQAVANFAPWEWDNSTGRVVWSEESYALFGISPDNATLFDTLWRSLIDPEDIATVEAAMQQCLTTGSTEVEYRIHHPELGVRWIFSRGGVALDNPSLVRGVSFDFTDRKQAELERHQNQEMIRRQLAEIEAIYQTAPIGLAILDRDLRFVRLNQGLAEINGISIADHLGRTIREIVPDLADTVEPMFRQVLATGEPLLNLEINGETAAQPGIQRTWLESWFPLKDANGEIIGINAVVQEITQRKQAEQELQRSEAAFRTISNAAPALVWACDAAGNNIYMNDRWCEYTGQTLAEAAEYGWAAMMHPEDMERILPYWERCQQTGELYEGEVRYRRRDGEYRWHAFRALPRRNLQGQIEAWYGLSFDTHDRKQDQLNDQFLNDLDQRLRQLSDADAMAWETVSRIGEYLNVDLCSWDTVDLQADTITVQQEWRQAHFESVRGVHRMSEYLLPQVIDHHRTGQTLAIEDVTTHDYTAPVADNILQHNIRALIAVPWVEAERWVAMLVVNSCSVRHWRSDEVGLLQETVARL